MDTLQENSFFAVAAPIELLINIYNKLPSRILVKNAVNKAHRQAAIMALFSRQDPDSVSHQHKLLEKWKNFSNFPWKKNEAVTGFIKNHLWKQTQNSQVKAHYKLSALLFILIANGMRPEKSFIEKLIRELMANDSQFKKKSTLPVLYTLFYALPLKESSSIVNLFITMALDNNNLSNHFVGCEALRVLPPQSVSETSPIMEKLLFTLKDNSPQKVKTTKLEIACLTITALPSIFLITEKSPLITELIELTKRRDYARMHACYALKALSLALTEQSSLVKEYVLDFENWKKQFRGPSDAWEALEALSFGLSLTKQSSIAPKLVKIMLNEIDPAALRGRFILERLSISLSQKHKAMIQHDLRAAMQDEKSVTRYIACVALEHLAKSLSLSERSRTVEILLEKFSDGESKVRHAAYNTLNALIKLSIFNQDRQFILKRILAGLQDQDTEIREICCDALLCFSSLSGDEQLLVLPALINIGLRDNYAIHRSRARMILTKFATFSPVLRLREQEHSYLIKNVLSGLTSADIAIQVKTTKRLEPYELLIALAPFLDITEESSIMKEVYAAIKDDIIGNSAIRAVVALSPTLALTEESPILFTLSQLATYGEQRKEAREALASLMSPLECQKESRLIGELVDHLESGYFCLFLEKICKTLEKLSRFISLKNNSSLLRSLFIKLNCLVDQGANRTPLISADTLGKLFPLFSLEEQNTLLPKILPIMLKSETYHISSKFLSNLSLSKVDHNPEVLDLLISALKKENKSIIRINACKILNAISHSFKKLPLEHLIATLLSDKTLFRGAGMEFITSLLLSGKIPLDTLIAVQKMQDRSSQYILLDALMICREKYIASIPILYDRSRFFSGYTEPCKEIQNISNDMGSNP